MSDRVEITRRIEFDAGHRIPNHDSKCRFPHGHRYRLEVTVLGPVKGARGESDDGMVVDFGILKKLMMEEVHNEWDHHFLYWKEDRRLIHGISVMGQEGFVRLDVVPTAENLASIVFKKLDARISEVYGNDEMALSRVRLYETPNCWADVTAPLSGGQER